MTPRLNLKGIALIIEEIKSKVLNNFITNVSIVNSSDILLSFSFYKKEKLLISLNHTNPFIGFISDNYNSHTTLGSLNENLRKYLKGSYVIDINQINNDRVIKITLTKTNDFYEKETFYLILELIPTINNLILLDEKETIIFAKHYVDLSASRPVLRGMKYEPVEANPNLVIKDFDLNEYKKAIREYLLEIDNKTQKEKSLPLYNHLKQKEKSLKKKIVVLNNEKRDAEQKLSYKEIGDTLLTLLNDKDNLNSYITTIIDTYDQNLSAKENAIKYFEKYKKARRTIENDEREIKIAEDNIKDINHILNIFSYYSDEEIDELNKIYLPKKSTIKKNKSVDARLPYFITVNGVKIGFGKNKEQNNYLTFKKANGNDIYLHTSMYHGAHVIIFNSDPDEEVILTASEICLILSNLTSGDVYISDVKDVKKGSSLGEVIINKYETITLHNVRESTKLLLKEQKRFAN